MPRHCVLLTLLLCAPSSQMARLADLTRGVEKLLEKYNGTRAHLKEVETTLTLKEVQLQQIREDELVDAAAAALAGSGVEVGCCCRQHHAPCSSHAV